MAQRAFEDDLTILEAVDNLSSMADLDLEEVKQKGRDALEMLLERAQWLDLDNKKQTQEKIKQTFNVVHNYMKHVTGKKAKELVDQDVQKGVRAIMGLARAAAARVDELYQVIDPKKQTKVVRTKAFTDLEKYYHKQVADRFKEVLDLQDEWVEEFANTEKSSYDAYARKIRDVEEIKRDHEYELLYIKKEDGRRFISEQLLQNMRLVTEFDEMMVEVVGDDPLVYVKVVQDKDAYATANEIVDRVHDALESFFTVAKAHQQEGLVRAIYKAILALIAASNRENMIQEKRQKTCLAYFRDFHYHLRNLVHHEDYLRLMANRSGWQKYEKVSMELINQLCGSFFLHSGDQVQSVTFVKELLERGQLKKVEASRFCMWNWLLDCYDSVHQLLRHYPSGPLLKSVDVFKDQEYKKGYTPIDHDNIPYELYKFNVDGHECKCIKLPSPTAQKEINKAEVLEEFRAFLRSLDKKQKLLIFNLQDRTSWKEHARADTLERLQHEPEFSEKLVVVTLAKQTPFYYQKEEYAHLNGAGEFKKELLDQVKNGRTCGYYLPTTLNTRSIYKFCHEVIEQIHIEYFNGNDILTRKNRLDFIEIFYQYLELKLIFMVQPTLLSFSCKDGVDIGSTASFALFGFFKLLMPTLKWTDEEKDLVLQILFTPALLVRERNIEIERLTRVVSVLSLINAAKDADRAQFAKLTKTLFKGIHLQDLEVYPSNY